MTRSAQHHWRGALVAAALSWPLAGTAWAQAGANWVESGGVPQGTRYSTLTDITPNNAATLTEEFSVATGAIGAHEGGPLVVGSTMYVVTPWPNKLIALDLAHNGAVLWTYSGAQTAAGAGKNGRGNRGPAYANGMVVYCELDGHVVAVNATTGKLAWATQVFDPNVTQETLPIAPIIVNNKVIIGDAMSEMGARGMVRALDLNTGKLLWKAYNTGPDSDVLIDASFKPFYAKDQGKDLGKTSWPKNGWQVGGGTVWEWITYDPGTNLIFYGTSQPGTFNADQRPGDNKWGASVFARNPDTGKAVWAYQLTPNDSWDYDATNEYTVVDLTIAGKLRKTLVHFSKNGFAYVLDRTNGQLISATPYSDGTNWATSVNLTTGLPNIDPAKITHQGQIASGICPSALGGKDWEYSSYSPVTGLFYFGLNNFCMHYQPLLTQYIPHAPYFGVGTLSFDPSPNFNGHMGALVAWDPVQAKAVWSVPEAYPLVGPGTLATAGGLVFYGTSDAHFKALDARTGAVLWQTQLECPVVSNPITYTAPDGKQRVAVYAGSATCPANSATGGEAAVHPSIKALYKSVPALKYQNAAAKSGYLHVFKLP
jgi:alcohol dehydrogenase (cytochrome c)